MDWKRLNPLRPLGPGDPDYVPRKTSGGERLADLVRARLRPIAITGPAGSGKSTELARAAEALQGDAVTVLVQLDRVLNMQRFDFESLLLAVASRVANLAVRNLGLQLSDPLMKRFAQLQAIPAVDTTRSDTFKGDAGDLLRATIREVAKKARQGRVALLVDGLEKAPDAHQAVATLLSFEGEADIVFVVPHQLVLGPDAHDLLERVKPFLIPALPVFAADESQRLEARTFLREVAGRRLGITDWPTSFVRVIEIATIASAGVLRTFLRILQDAGGYARVAGREAPTADDVAEAVRDVADGLRRVMRDGDREMLGRINLGFDSQGFRLETRLRLLSHGLLLEYEERRDEEVVRLEKPHPLAFAENVEAIIRSAA